VYGLSLKYTYYSYSLQLRVSPWLLAVPDFHLGLQRPGPRDPASLGAPMQFLVHLNLLNFQNNFEMVGASKCQVRPWLLVMLLMAAQIPDYRPGPQGTQVGGTGC
jgi:hypothetical protein